MIETFDFTYAIVSVASLFTAGVWLFMGICTISICIDTIKWTGGERTASLKLLGCIWLIVLLMASPIIFFLAGTSS